MRDVEKAVELIEVIQVPNVPLPEEIKDISSVAAALNNKNLVTPQKSKQIYFNHEAPSILRKSSDVMTKVIAVGFGSMSGIPVVNIARQFFGEQYRILGWISGGCVIVSSAAISTWAWSNLFNNVTQTLADAKPKNRCFTFFKISSLITNSVVAIVSLVPNLYATFKYNNNVIIWPIMSFISEWGIRTYALYELTRHISLVEGCSNYMELRYFKDIDFDVAKKIQKIKYAFGRTCEYGIQAFNSYGDKFRRKSFPNFFLTQQDINSTDYIEQIIKSLYLSGIKEETLQNSYSTCVHNWGKRILFTLNLGFPLSILYLFYNLSYEATGYITDIIPLRVIFSLITILPNAYLDFFALKNIIFNMSDQLFNTLTCQNKYSLAYQLYPGTISVGYVLSLLVTLFTLPVITKISSDLFKTPFGHVVTVSNIIQVLIYALNASTDITNKSIENAILYWGNASEKSLIEWSRKLQSVITDIKQMDLDLFADFINNLGDQKFQKLIMGTEVNVDEIQNFISKAQMVRIANNPHLLHAHSPVVEPEKNKNSSFAFTASCQIL